MYEREDMAQTWTPSCARFMMMMMMIHDDDDISHGIDMDTLNGRFMYLHSDDDDNDDDDDVSQWLMYVCTGQTWTRSARPGVMRRMTDG